MLLRALLVLLLILNVPAHRVFADCDVCEVAPKLRTGSLKISLSLAARVRSDPELIVRVSNRGTHLVKLPSHDASKAFDLHLFGRVSGANVAARPGALDRDVVFLRPGQSFEFARLLLATWTAAVVRKAGNYRLNVTFADIDSNVVVFTIPARSV